MAEPAAPRPDWPTQAADTIVRYVDRVKAGTTDRAMALAKGVVYGTFATILGIVLVIVLLIGLFRGVDRLRDLVVADSVWLTYVSLGTVFVVAGQLVFSRRRKVS
jgi:hypothetical protein